MIELLRPDITLERLPPYHCELNAIEMVQRIVKNKVRKYPFKNVHDVQALARKAFDEVTPDVVRNTLAHVEEQENWYRHLDEIM